MSWDGPRWSSLLLCLWDLHQKRNEHACAQYMFQPKCPEYIQYTDVMCPTLCMMHCGTSLLHTYLIQLINHSCRGGLRCIHLQMAGLICWVWCRAHQRKSKSTDYVTQELSLQTAKQLTLKDLCLIQSPFWSQIQNHALSLPHTHTHTCTHLGGFQQDTVIRKTSNSATVCFQR